MLCLGQVGFLVLQNQGFLQWDKTTLGSLEHVQFD